MQRIMPALVVLSLLFWTSGLAAQESNPLATVEGAPDLEKVKRGKFRETWVNMDVDFTRYDKVYLGRSYFDYRDIDPAPRYRSSMSTRSRAVYGLSPEEQAFFEQVAGEAFDKEFAKGKRYTITEEVDEQTLIMHGAVVDIISRVPGEYVGRSELYLSSIGEATLVLELVDGGTGEVLARVAERGVIGSNNRQIDSFSMPTNKVTIRADIARWASRAARRLRSELDAAIESG